MLKLVNFFTPRRIKFILFVMWLSKYYYPALKTISLSRQMWSFYRQIQDELTRELPTGDDDKQVAG